MCWVRQDSCRQPGDDDDDNSGGDHGGVGDHDNEDNDYGDDDEDGDDGVFGQARVEQETQHLASSSNWENDGSRLAFYQRPRAAPKQTSRITMINIHSSFII